MAIPDLLPADWLASLRDRAEQPPARPREALCVDGVACGSIEPGLARQLVQAGLPLRHDGRWTLDAPADEALAEIARWLHEHGHGGRWRDERLAVAAADDARVLGAIERAAVRALGIATRAVHLVGTTPSGEVWVQQRALDKAVDPGLLDTLVGGLAAAGESTHETLARETWEEAGLRLAALQDLRPLGRRWVRRPVSDGYMVEQLEMFEAVVPDTMAPDNQDGEVMAFVRMAPPALCEALAAERFTLEAALIHAHWLATPRTGGVPRGYG